MQEKKENSAYFECPYCRRHLCPPGKAAEITLSEKDFAIALKQAIVIAKFDKSRQLVAALHEATGRRMSRDSVLKSLRWPIPTFQEHIKRMKTAGLVKYEGAEVELADFLIPPFTPSLICSHETGIRHPSAEFQ